MPSPIRNTALKVHRSIERPLSIKKVHSRLQSSTTHNIIGSGLEKERQELRTAKPEIVSASPLARLSTSSILRTLLLSTFFTRPILFRCGFAVFEKIAKSPSPWLNPDRNPLLRAAIYPLIYKQFCAGRNQTEIGQTSAEIRGLGFSGIVLCYGKEVQVQADKLVGYSYSSPLNTMDAEISQWADGNIRTLDMVGEGDWLGIKFTGAGTKITQALMNGEDAPAKFVEAMDRICEHAASKGCRIWIDAEQQVLQAAIDAWTFDLMRRHNAQRKQALVYNTIQAYLKSAREKVQHQLELSRREGWRLGIKLVRGAYIANDKRERIHNTKADTDASYNTIVEDLLRGRFPAQVGQGAKEIDLILAGHNTASIRKAARLASELAAQSRLKVRPDFGQLQGMADDIGCELLQVADDVQAREPSASTQAFVPKVYKCLTWGSIQECMQYLTRRLVENRGASERMKVGAAEFRKELLRRMGTGF
ncbi:proline dehydrogenase [Cladophialophora chaetospira]|uniref:Proline dehydrogenase n=1 Tax=Cladophialophora chaetospira TaxID=386627 RepID=A0AA38X8P1_9EURO|nr:proline dehydrogenase [Cladophialophora chaetospira]